jgi:hypothetical protein
MGNESLMTFPTLRKAKEYLDAYLGLEGCYHDGAHYIRPDRSKGPIISYSWGASEMLFGATRGHGGAWEITVAFCRNDVPALTIMLADLWEQLGASPFWVDDEGILYRWDDLGW